MTDTFHHDGIDYPVELLRSMDRATDAAFKLVLMTVMQYSRHKEMDFNSAKALSAYDAWAKEQEK